MQEADEFCAENEPTGQEWSQNGLRAPEDKLEVATEKIEVAIQSATIMSPGGTPPPAICWGIGRSGPSALKMLLKKNAYMHYRSPQERRSGMKVAALAQSTPQRLPPPWKSVRLGWKR